MLTVVTFLAVCSLTLLLFLLLGGRNQRVEARVQDLSGENRPQGTTGSVSDFARIHLPKLAMPLVPKDESVRVRLRTRLIHAGLYGRPSMSIFLGVKMLLIFLPVIIGVALGLAHAYPLLLSVLLGLVAAGMGMIVPSFWLDWRKQQRQTNLRRALPDALDIIVICVEGGLSLQAGFQRVAGSLGTAHPLLASELNIVQREIQMGRSSGEALRQFGERCDLEEIRSLASVVLQAERLGASIVKSLRVHAETLRIKRLQRAEELAHMAGTKMVFPTLLFIFPAILFVIAGPAAFHVMELFSSMNK